MTKGQRKAIPLCDFAPFLNWGTSVKGYLPQVDEELPRAHIRTECACCFCQPDLPWQGHYAYLKVPGQ